MTTNKRRKVRKYRGSKTHGCGSMKKRRGAGNRGGRGNAGSGKRADTTKPSFIKLGRVFGKHGFKKKNKIILTATTIRYLETRLNTFLENGLIKEKSGKYEVDLKELGYNKLLSTGIPTKKWSITAEYASNGAEEKIKSAGGSLVLTAIAAENAEEEEEEEEEESADAEKGAEKGQKEKKQEEKKAKAPKKDPKKKEAEEE